MYKKITTITEEFDNPPMASVAMSCPSSIHAAPSLIIQLMEYSKTSVPSTEQINTMVERMYMMSASCNVLSMGDYPAIIAP